MLDGGGDRSMQIEPAGENELRVFSLSADAAVASYQNAVICHFRGLTLESLVPAVQRAFTTAAQDGRVVFLAVIETTSPPPDDKARQAFIRMFDEWGDKIAVALVTIRGDGFRAAMVRVISSGILNFVRFRVRFPKHIGGSMEEAASRAAEHGMDAAKLLSAFQRLSQMR
jgi:hypothetical protein